MSLEGLEEVRISGAGVTGSCEPPDEGAGSLNKNVLY